MLTRELLKQVKKIEIKTRYIVESIFAGEYTSVFKGRGIEFAEVRDYQYGDDVRSIDWNVTARMSTPYIKKFTEERELTVLLAVDMSASQKFTSNEKSKGEILAEISAILSLAATKSNDKIGVILFSDKIEKYLPPRKGLHYVLRVIREILYFNPSHNKTDIAQALEFIGRVQKRRCILFILSDFISPPFLHLLKVIARKHDTIAIYLYDPLEFTMPPGGIIFIEDLETGELIKFTASPKNLQLWKQLRKKSLEKLRYQCKSNKVDIIEISTRENYILPLIKFFHERALRYRR